jgi:hypothetical protein
MYLFSMLSSLHHRIMRVQTAANREMSEGLFPKKSMQKRQKIKKTGRCDDENCEYLFFLDCSEQIVTRKRLFIQIKLVKK